MKGGFSLVAALEIANNYPDQIRIEAYKKNEPNGKFGAVAIRLKGEDEHKQLCFTPPKFSTAEEASQDMDIRLAAIKAKVDSKIPRNE